MFISIKFVSISPSAGKCEMALQKARLCHRMMLQGDFKPMDSLDFEKKPLEKKTGNGHQEGLFEYFIKDAKQLWRKAI